MAKILVVYHSQTGNTEKMARAVADGASSFENTELSFKRTILTLLGFEKPDDYLPSLIKVVT